MLCPLVQTLTAGLIGQEVGGVLKGWSRPIEWVLGGFDGMARMNSLMAGLHKIGRVLIKEDHVTALLHIDTTLTIGTDLTADHDRHHCMKFADVVS